MELVIDGEEVTDGHTLVMGGGTVEVTGSVRAETYHRPGGHHL